MKAKTTDLAKLKEGHPFTWGTPLEWHQIGPYAILEFRMIFNGEPREISYHIWIDGYSIGHSAPTLDEAIVLAIAHRAEGPNQKASEYFMKMIAS